MMRRFAFFVFVLFLAIPQLSYAYKKGDISVSGGGSLKFDPDGSVFVISLGVGYFVIDGLEVATSTSVFLGADPFVAQLQVGPRYIFYQIPTVKPYIGGFYRHWFIAKDIPDIDSIGARGGIIIQPSKSPLYISGGLIYERIISQCSDDCDSIYPELSFSLHF